MQPPFLFTFCKQNTAIKFVFSSKSCYGRLIIVPDPVLSGAVVARTLQDLAPTILLLLCIGGPGGF
jgi:hypothetical protein